MSDTPAAAEPCEHHWLSTHEPGHRLYWVRICALCHAPDWDDLDREIDALKATP